MNGGWKDLKLEEVCLQIIALSGDAKSKAYKAFAEAEKGAYANARQLLKEADDNIGQAHKIQFELISNEAREGKIAPTLLLIHAMDILMTAMSEKELIRRMVNCLKKCNNSSHS